MATSMGLRCWVSAKHISYWFHLILFYLISLSNSAKRRALSFRFKVALLFAVLALPRSLRGVKALVVIWTWDCSDSGSRQTPAGSASWNAKIRSLLD